MERIITIDLKDYDESMQRFRRPSVRAVIIRDYKVAMVYSAKFDYYKFPGGGIEKTNHIFKHLFVRSAKKQVSVLKLNL